MKNKLLNSLPDLILFCTIICTLALGSVFSDMKLFISPITYIFGAIFIIGGLGLSTVVLAYVIRHGGSTDIIRTSESLITKRYFSFSRNPLYLAELMIVTGVAILTGSLVALVGPLIYILILNAVIIPYEERGLEKAFGQKYMRYKQSTRRWM